MNIENLIDLVSDEKINLSQILLKMKILVHGLDDEEINSWIENELNGYPLGSTVPDYRIVPSRVLATFSNFQYRYNNHPIPLAHLDENARKSLESAKIIQSISALENTAREKSNLTRPLPFEFYGLLGKGLDSSYEISSAQCDISNMHITQIITNIRSRVLTALLNLKSKIGNKSSIGEQEIANQKSDISQLLNSAVFGDNTTIIVGHQNSQSVSNKNIRGDCDALASALKEAGIEKDEIQNLNQILSNDTPDNSKKEFGPGVNSWIKKMLAKAIDGAWQVKIEAAGALLANAIQAYYGWK